MALRTERKAGERQMEKIKQFLKKELMLTVSVLAAIISFFITPPSAELFSYIDWRTLGILFMMLTILEGFKQESIFRPLLLLAGKLHSMAALSLFLVFSVFNPAMILNSAACILICFFCFLFIYVCYK